MKKIKDEDVMSLNKKLAHISVEIFAGKVKEIEKLAEVIHKEFPTDKELLFALTMLLADRWLKAAELANGVMNINKGKGTDRPEIMFG